MFHSPIFIVGMPACGKSTFGRSLARCLCRRFIDLDSYIENRFHTSVKTLFAERGETTFRKLEAAMLREVGEFEDVVVATGGGAPCHSDNMEYMNGRGICVWLQASMPRIMARVRRKPEQRPLLAGLDNTLLGIRLTQMAQTRTPFYGLAAIHFATDHLEDRAQIDEAVRMFLSLPQTKELL